MEQYLVKEKATIKKTLIDFLNDEWLDCMCGERVDFDASMMDNIFGINMDAKTLIKKYNKLTGVQVRAMISYFESGKELYRLKDRS